MKAIVAPCECNKYKNSFGEVQMYKLVPQEILARVGHVQACTILPFSKCNGNC